MEDRKPKTPEKSTCDALNELLPNTTESSTSPAYSAESALHDNPDYIPPNQQDILLLDVNSKTLHSKVSAELDVKYLSGAEGPQSSPVYGRLYGFNKRLMVNVVTRRRSRRGERGPEYPSVNVIFLCDTGSPNTFICEEAMRVLLGENARDIIPDTLLVQMADFPAVEANVSPNPSHYSDANVIGMDLLSHLQMTVFGKDLEFELTNMEHTVQRQSIG